MSAIMPNSASPLVQQIQERDTDIVRSQQQAQQAFQDELTRRGSEVVQQAGETDQNGIDEDPEKEHGGGHKKQKNQRGYPQEEEEAAKGWTMGPDDDGKPHRINIIA